MGVVESPGEDAAAGAGAGIAALGNRSADGLPGCAVRCEGFGRGFDEFEERTLLSHEPLPNSAAAVIRAHGETYLRRLTQGTMQRMSDMSKKSANINMVMAETRPLQRAQKYTFVAPKGLVRWNQTAGPKERLPMTPEDMVDAKNSKSTLDKQVGSNVQKAEKSFDKKAQALPSGAFAEGEKSMN